MMKHNPGEGLIVCIVEDDETDIFLHKSYVTLSNLSDKPLAFLNGTKVTEFISEEAMKDANYLILLDINMPIMNGWDFLEWLDKSGFSDRVFVAIVTSSIDNRDVVKARKFKTVVDFIEKPFTIQACERLKKAPKLAHIFK